ncbi:MAG: glycoside hydrolase family 25 [Clostridia bacterium]|nr:glycoside hydrolase family 25 [Clostridia bacterium]
MIKKLFCLILGIFIVLSFAACSDVGGSSGESGVDTESGQSSLIPDTDDPDAAADTEETSEPEVTDEPAPVIRYPAENDDTPPFFIVLNSRIRTVKSISIDMSKYFAYADDLDPEVEMTVEGDFDTNTAGSYQVRVVISDHSGNSTSANVTVEVLESAPETQPPAQTDPEPRITFAEFMQKYKNAGTSVGIDVSKWQGNIDFEKVAAAGCEFVIIRIGGYVDGCFTDTYFKNNIKNAKAAGLKVGIYWYSQENSPELVMKNMDYLFDELGGETLDLPIYFDWEDFTHFQNYKMSVRDLNNMFAAFCLEAESRGYRAGLYNSKYFLGLMWSEESKEKDLWLALYADQMKYDGDVFMWQQGIGRIDGINGDVDVNVLYG